MKIVIRDSATPNTVTTNTNIAIIRTNVDVAADSAAILTNAVATNVTAINAVANGDVAVLSTIIAITVITITTITAIANNNKTTVSVATTNLRMNNL